MLEILVKLVPELNKSHLDYVIKIASSSSAQGEGPGDDTATGLQVAMTETPALPAAKAKTKSPILLVRFTDKALRNKVFFEAKKNKDTFKPKLVIRDDMTKDDHAAWTLAKPQMQVAHTAGQRSKCRHGRLTIENNSTPIEGLLSQERKIHEINTAAKIPYNRDDVDR